MSSSSSWPPWGATRKGKVENRARGVRAHFKTDGGRDCEQLSQSPTLKPDERRISFDPSLCSCLLGPPPARLDHWPSPLTSAPRVCPLNLLQTALYALIRTQLAKINARLPERNLPPPRTGPSSSRSGVAVTPVWYLKGRPKPAARASGRAPLSLPDPRSPSPVETCSRRSSPSPSDSHPPGYTTLDPHPASAAAPPPPPPALQSPARPPLREPPPRRGSTDTSSPPLPAYAGPLAGGGGDGGRRRGREPGGRAGAGPAAGVSTWGGGGDVAGTPPGRRAGNECRQGISAPRGTCSSLPKASPAASASRFNWT